MSRRRVRPDELELWNRVARQARPMHPHPRQPRPKPKPAERLVPKETDTREPIPPFEIGEAARRTDARHDIAPPLSDRMAQQPVSMDRKAFGRMKRGKLRPEGRIDLHGMTLEEAHPALTGFILQSAATGRRLVLVITGKGCDSDGHGPVPQRRGILRQQVPQWLRMAPLRDLVLQISEAHRSHGGTGAFYVYLRRKR